MESKCVLIIMENEKLRSTLNNIKRCYRKGRLPPRISLYPRQHQGVYLTKDEQDLLVEAKMIEVLNFSEGYQRVRLTEKGIDALNPKQSERYG